MQLLEDTEKPRPFGEEVIIATYKRIFRKGTRGFSFRNLHKKGKNKIKIMW